jgi:hypothetical protein
MLARIRMVIEVIRLCMLGPGAFVHAPFCPILLASPLTMRPRRALQFGKECPSFFTYDSSDRSGSSP